MPYTHCVLPGEKIQERIDIFKTKLDNYTAEDSIVEAQETALKNELNENTGSIAENMKVKMNKINEFENKYSQYIFIIIYFNWIIYNLNSFILFII